MNSSPKISVVMPAHNTGRYIKDAIDSILNQTFTDFEFIIIDDCSTDDSYRIIKEYLNKDDRIILFRNEKNLGIASTRTKGTLCARGKYIVTMDSDDISLPTRLEKQYKYLEAHKDCGVVGSHVEMFNGNNEIVGTKKFQENDIDLRKRIFLYSPVVQPAAMVRKEVFDNIGYYDPKYVNASDLDFWFRLGTKYKFSNIQEVLLRYRIHNGSITVNNLKRLEKVTLDIREKYSKGYGYSMSLFDKIINWCIRNTGFVPYDFKMWLFYFIRSRVK